MPKKKVKKAVKSANRRTIKRKMQIKRSLQKKDALLQRTSAEVDDDLRIFMNKNDLDKYELDAFLNNLY